MILVTGGTGFLGSHLCQLLIEEGYTVRVLSRGAPLHMPETVAKKILSIRGNVRNPEDVKQAMKDVDVVFHLAATVPHPVKYFKPDEWKIFDTNGGGTCNVLREVVKSDVNQVIFSSTQEVYGTPQCLPIDELHLTSPNTLYGYSKLFGEQCCRIHWPDTTILRYSTIYGPRQWSKEVLPSFMKKARNNHEFITVYGDGSQTRDFVSVWDVAKANVACIGKRGFNIYNVGSGVPISILELAEYMIDLFGSDTEIRFSGEAKQPQHFYLDIEKAKKHLNHNPIPLLVGIKRFYEALK